MLFYFGLALCFAPWSDSDVLLLFFFKQKTAYEMRISDWSSDVCSSDLLFIPFGGVRRDRIGGELARHLLNGALVVGQLELVGHFPVSIMASASISTFHSGRSRPATTAIVAAGRRSEEHTSDLQSLMRTSYAVFFLQKKKSTIQ